MSEEFDIKITAKDMYRFNMYHAYHGFQGIFASVLGIAVIVIAILSIGTVDTMYTIIYILFGIVFLVYVPVSLYLRSKRQISTSPILKNSLHYQIDEQGIHVSQQEQTALLEWKQIYKMVSTKSNLLIYSTRVNAYVIPMEALGKQYDTIKKLAEQHLESYRRKLRQA